MFYFTFRGNIFYVIQDCDKNRCTGLHVNLYERKYQIIIKSLLSEVDSSTNSSDADNLGDFLD